MYNSSKITKTWIQIFHHYWFWFFQVLEPKCVPNCYTYFKWQKRLPPIIVEKWLFKNYCLKMHRKVFCKFCQQPTVTKKFRRSLFCQFCQLFKYFTCKLTKLKTNMRIPQDVLRSQDAISKGFRLRLEYINLIFNKFLKWANYSKCPL